MRVFFATDRDRTSQSDPQKMFSGKRGTLSYGSCDVTIPSEQKTAVAGSPAADIRPALRKIVPRDRKAFLSQLRSAIAKNRRRSAFVFVHGYNVSFAEAARRAAQLKHDLGFEGAAILFSWPAKGRSEAGAFVADETDVEWAQPDLKAFLKEIAATSQARNIYLIGHSMGNRALTKAYIYLSSERPELAKVFRELILIAPDIDADLFGRDLAPQLAASATRTTVYSSSKDPFLKAGSRFQSYRRVGDSGPMLAVYEGIETIDASRVNTALSGHAHPSDKTSVIADIYHLIREGKRPAERSGLQTVHADSGQYWRFRAR